MRTPTTSIALTMLAVLLMASFSSSQAPKIDYFFPSGGQRGHTVNVTAGGNFANWPPNTWTNSKELTVVPRKEKGQLAVTIAANAVPGRHWIRLYDAEGATSLRPFVVGTIREANETSDEIDAMDLSSPVAINGRLSANNEVDTYSFTLQPGEHFVASLDAHGLVGSPMDAVMQLYDLDHQVVLAQVDDAPDRDPWLDWPKSDSKRTDRPATHSTNVAIRLFAFPETPNQRIGFSGAENFIYRLTLSKTGFVDYATPLSISESRTNDVRLVGWNLDESLDEDRHQTEIRFADNATTATVFRESLPGFATVKVQSLPNLIEPKDIDPDSPLPLTLPVTITGLLDKAEDVDAFSISATKSTGLTFRVDARSLGFPTDPLLEIFDDSGKRLHRIDDSSGRDCSLQFTPPATSNYTIVVRDLFGHGGPRHHYLFTATEQKPTFRLAADSELHTAETGVEYAMEVTVKRENGFNQPIHIAAVGLPDNVVTYPATSQPDNDSSKKVTIRMNASAVAAGPFQIVGTTPQSDRVLRAETPTAIPNTGTTQFWFTATPAKDAPPDTTKKPESP